VQNQRAGLRDSELLVAEVMMCESPESNLTAPLLFELARFGIGLPIITSAKMSAVLSTPVCQAETSYDTTALQQLTRTRVTTYLQQEEILLD
jgi:hypothetical protein